MKHTLLLALAVTGLSGCATYQGAPDPNADSGVVYGTSAGTAPGTTSDFDRGEQWRNTPNATREHAPASSTIPRSVFPEDRATGGFHQ